MRIFMDHTNLTGLFAVKVQFFVLRGLAQNPYLGFFAEREMVRLTADLIWKSSHFFNAIRERELDLRGKLRSYFYLYTHTHTHTHTFMYVDF